MSTDEMRSNSASEEKWRLFVAVPMPDAVRGMMADVQASLRRHDWPVKWVDPDLAHITLKFLGDTDSATVPAIESALETVVTDHRAAHVTTGAVGAFPSVSHARVMWIGLDGDLSPLADLAGDVDRTMTELGFQGEDRPFRAHITLGRLRRDAKPPRDFEDVALQVSVPEIEVRFDRVQLVRSVLGRSGPSYTTLAEWELAANLDSVTDPVELTEHG